MHKISQFYTFAIHTTFVITISNVCKANEDEPAVQKQTAFFTPSVLHPNGLAQSANKTNSSPLQIKMYALPPLTLAVFAQPVSPVDAAKLRTREQNVDNVVHTSLISWARLAYILCHRGSCVEQKSKDGGGDGESHGE